MADRTKFVLPNGDVMAPSDAAGQAMLEGWGARPQNAQEQHADQLKEKYSEWYYAVPAAVEGAVKGAAPGLQAAALSGLEAASPDTARSAADFLQGTRDAHPMADMLGMFAGAAGGAVASGGASLAAAPVVGAAMTADELALRHIQTPEGSEKIFSELGVGALLGLGFGVAGKFVGNRLAAGALRKAGEAAEAKGEQVLMKTTLPGKSAPWLDARGQLEDATAYLVNNDMAGKTPKEVRAFLSERAKVSSSIMEEAKRATKGQALTPGKQQALANDLKGALEGTGVEGRALRLNDLTRKADLKQLHNLRRNIDAKINWTEYESTYSQQLIKGRNLVNQSMDDLLTSLGETNAKLADQAGRWAAASKEFANLSNVRGALAAAGPKAPEGFFGTLKSWAARAGSAMVAGGALGIPHVSAPLGFVMKEVAGAAKGLATPPVLGRGLQGLGSFLQTVDDRAVSVIVSKIGGKGLEGAVQQEGATLGVYSNLAAVFSLLQENPNAAVPKMAETMVAAGVPMEVAQAAVPVALRAIQHVTEGALPANPYRGQTVAPEEYEPSLLEKTRFLDTVNTIADPMAVLSGDPTPAQIATLRAVYPEMMKRFTSATMDHIAHNPGLSAPAKRWASAVTGIPAGPLDIPNVRAMMNLSEAKLAQQRLQAAQQTQVPSQGGPGASKPAQQFQTQYQRLLK